MAAIMIKGVGYTVRNPYEVLGIREGTDIEGIKRAYRELVRKYHPDQYRNNPLSDLAEEKLKEINEAYDYLMRKAEAAETRSDYNYNSRNSNYDNSESNGRGYFDQARAFINMGNIAAAEEILDRASVRDAEWHYLKGLVYMRRGWYNEAVTNLRTASDMAPGNYEYREALNRVMNANRQYQSTVYNRRGYDRNPDLCSICECMVCTDCCCECMGGDFISCC
ncbi:MAG: J domain-containing protein [Caulobacteraceae bacterium]